MMSKNTDKKREQIQFFSMEDLVPQNHLLRDIDRAINFSFIYDLVIDKYSEDQGRPSIDPVMLIKIPFYFTPGNAIYMDNNRNIPQGRDLFPHRASSFYHPALRRTTGAIHRR